jgi:cytochrome c oxidase accessory protein FixG
VFFDLPHRRFHVLMLTLVPQDLLLLAGMLLLAALTLFFVTSLAGRLWCGYACPQTVWTEAFMWMEQLCEGDRYARIKLDRAPLSAEKILRKGSKHLLWATFSLYTGLTFVAFFFPARELFPAAARFDLHGWPLFWTLFYGFATWGNAGFMREQVCKYMCPYARFQSAMFDRDTLIVAYDEKRGEPRKSLWKKLVREPGPAAVLAGEVDALSPAAAAAASQQKLGDCIDCSMCVQVCPTGIDIRKGLQYECIACAACVDACNTVMDSVHKPHGLIHYTSARHDSGGAFKLLRPRTIGYGIVWLAAFTGFMTLVFTHSPLRFDVLRDRHALYREQADGAIENVYNFKVTNDDSHPHRYRISARFKDGTPLEAEPDEIERDADQTAATTITLRTPPRGADAEKMPMVEDVEVDLEDEDDAHVKRHRSARFLTGGK